MKKQLKLGVLLTLLLVCFSLPVHAMAPVASDHAVLWRNGITVNEKRAGFLNEAGRRVWPISYGGSVYIPLRTAGEWMGCGVEWDGGVGAVRLTSGKAAPTVREGNDAPLLTDPEMARLQELFLTGVTVTVRPDLQVTLDGVAQHFQNVAGQPVYPLVYDGSVYLPVRSIGALTGKKVAFISLSYALPAICIYDPITAAQQEQIRTFYQQQKQLVDQLPKAIEALKVASTPATVLARLDEITALLVQLQDTPQPEVPVAAFRANAIATTANEFQTGALAPYYARVIPLIPEATVSAVWEDMRGLLANRFQRLSGEVASFKDHTTFLGVTWT